MRFHNFDAVLPLKNTTVIGATGMLGKPVTRALVQNGFAVTALVRDKKKAHSMFGDSINYVEGNLQDTEAVKKALAGADAVYINLSVAQTSHEKDYQPERDGLATVLQLCKSMPNIKHVSYLSSIAQFYTEKNHWVLALKRKTVELVKQSGIPYTIFYPSTFVESLPYKQLQGNWVITAGHSPVQLWWIAAGDYARQVVHDFRLNPAESREYYIQGPQAFTMDEAVAVFVKNYPHKKLKIMNMPLWALKFAGMLARQANYGYQIIDGMANYTETFEAQKTWDELGKPLITLEEYAKGLPARL